MERVKRSKRSRRWRKRQKVHSWTAWQRFFPPTCHFCLPTRWCASLRCTPFHRYGAHVSIVTVHTNDSQEKSDNSREKSIATAGKNVIVCRDGKRKTDSRTAWQRSCLLFPLVCTLGAHMCARLGAHLSILGRTRVHP